MTKNTTIITLSARRSALRLARSSDVDDSEFHRIYQVYIIQLSCRSPWWVGREGGVGVSQIRQSRAGSGAASSFFLTMMSTPALARLLFIFSLSHCASCVLDFMHRVSRPITRASWVCVSVCTCPSSFCQHELELFFAMCTPLMRSDMSLVAVHGILGLIVTQKISLALILDVPSLSCAFSFCTFTP